MCLLDFLQWTPIFIQAVALSKGADVVAMVSIHVLLKTKWPEPT